MKREVHDPRRTDRRALYRQRLEPLERRLVMATFVVNSTLDLPDGEPGDGFADTGSSSSGSGSSGGLSGITTLRAAIEEANALDGPDVIEFNIPEDDQGLGLPAGSPRTIRPQALLPFLDGDLTIDGYSQPGSIRNPNTTDQGGSNARPLIEISGRDLDVSGTVGLMAIDGAVVLRGLVVNEFAGGPGIRLNAPGGLVAGCFLGTDVTGAIARPNNTGLEVGRGGATVGGTAAEDRNVISGNTGTGLLAAIANSFSAQQGPRIIGNLIGTTADGASGLGNGATGVFVEPLAPVEGTRIGGPTAAERNVIAGNGNFGIFLNDPDAPIGSLSREGGGLGTAGEGGPPSDLLDTRIEGNFIGSDAKGVAALGNRQGGIQIRQVEDVRVEANLIAHNGPIIEGPGGGIVMSGARAVNNSLLGNRIFDNDGPGIELLGDGPEEEVGPTPNDPGDEDSGANRLQNFPVFTEAVLIGPGLLRYAGTFDGDLDASFRIEFFASDSDEPDGVEGERFVDFARISTDLDGRAAFSGTLTGFVGRFLTATATDSPGSTSEFSASIPVDDEGEGPLPADLAVSIVDAPDPAVVGADLTYTITVSALAGDGLLSEVPEVNLVVNLPGGATFVSATGGATPTGGALAIPIGTVAVGSPAVVTVVVRPLAGSVVEGLGLTAEVTSETPEANSSNNEATATTAVVARPSDPPPPPPPAPPSANLSVAVASSSPSTTVGGDATFEVVVSNAGPDPATETRVTVTLPPGVTLVSATGGATPSGGVVTFDLQTLASGATARVAVVVRPTAPGEFTVSALATSSASDPASGDNSGAARVQAVSPEVVDRIGPRVRSVRRFGFHSQPTLLVVTFDDDLDPARAVGLSGYRLVSAGPDGRLGTKDDRAIKIASARYDAASRAVVLRSSQLLPLSGAYRLVMRGSGASALTDRLGNALNADGATAGSDFAVSLGRADLAGRASEARADAGRAVVSRHGTEAKAMDPKLRLRRLPRLNSGDR